jgi:ABC-type nitrate/sulfonate/bicarbonate transport system substrate-binding protein
MRQFFRALVAAAAIACVVASGAQAQSVTTLNVGIVSATSGEWATYVAQDLGYFKRYNVDPQLINAGSASATMQQALAGSIDIAETSPTQVVESITNGAPVHEICERLTSAPYSFVAQKQYKRYSDLKGKTLIIGGPADITVIFTEKMLASDGVKMSDVDFTYAGGTTERFAALHSGGVAAAILFPPFDSRAIAEGYTLLGTLPQVLPSFPFVGWTVADKWADSHADVLVRFLKGYLRGTRWLNDPKNRAQAIEILLKHTSTTPPDADKSYDAFVGRNKLFANDGVIAASSYQTIVDALIKIKVISAPGLAPTRFFDNKYVQQANAQLVREGP